MNRIVLRAMAVLARRDFTATVVSRTFLLFLIAPIFPLLFGLVFGAVGAKVGHDAHTSRIAVIAPQETGAAMAEAQRRIADIGGSAAGLMLSPIAPADDPEAQARALLGGKDAPAAVLVVAGENARLFGSAGSVANFREPVAWLLDEARRDIARGAHHIPNPPPGRITLVETGISATASPRDLTTLAQGAQTLLFVLTLMLAGVLISNFVEEKANKVIEVLAAAVPVPAIFLGKLLAMLGSSLVGVAVWGGTAALGLMLFLPAGGPSLPVPAVGWPLFAVLSLLYFSMNYLLVGALLLGIGAQAASIRQIQTLSLPVTMAQLLLYGFAASAIGDPDGPIGLASALFPFSSPLAMIARAAALPDIWPHLAALAWQALWVAITVGLMARAFRRGVLKSGPVRSSRKATAAA